MADFVERSNPGPPAPVGARQASASEGSELVATWGNPANRMPSFAHKRSEGHVPGLDDPSSSSPRPGSGQAGQGLDFEDRALLETIEAGFEPVGDLYAACKFRAALGEALSLARETNAHLDRKAPWFQIKEDRVAAATMVDVTRSVRATDSLKTILAPILPHTAQQLHEYLGYEGQPIGSTQDGLFGWQYVIEVKEETRSHQALTYDHTGAIGEWTPGELPAGQVLRRAAPVFKKRDTA